MEDAPAAERRFKRKGIGATEASSPRRTEGPSRLPTSFIWDNKG